MSILALKCTFLGQNRLLDSIGHVTYLVFQSKSGQNAVLCSVVVCSANCYCKCKGRGRYSKTETSSASFLH